MNEFEQGMIGALLSGTYLAGQLPVLLAAGLWAKRFRPIKNPAARSGLRASRGQITVSCQG